MTKYVPDPELAAQITPEHLYINRRKFMRIAAAAGIAAALAACGVREPAAEPTSAGAADSDATAAPGYQPGTTEMGEEANSFEQVSGYNNFYEFTVSKEDVQYLADDFTTSPWQLEVGGLVNNPRTYGADELKELYQPEERVYRLRCVEGWSMVIPWAGFPISKLLNDVEPTTDAKYVRFQTVWRPEEMRGQNSGLYPWPYLEGLRLDEAMNDLAILATGLYGRDLPPQNGAPVRLVVPWKYGFKSIKSIVKLELVSEMPPTFWNTIAAHEYGFYANVNPEVSHPRWSQSSERRIGESGRRETLLFNGYADQVAHLYEGMDLAVNY
jgi:sulfoxide reductase catalytic subunit YedY